MKLGILGGTFDPVHLGHLLMAELAREELGLDRVLFVPAGDPPHKQDVPVTPAYHRRAMLERAIAAVPAFALCPVDLDRPGPHYSVDTVGLIRSQERVPGENCWFIIGADSLADLPTWYRPAELISLCRLAVACRPGYRPNLAELETVLPGITYRLDWVEMPAVGVAATDIRARCRAGRTIRYQVVEAVRAYIEQHGLYR